ncbi:cupin domain-containing protein [uncultured Roseibium sp.]|uniref:cupin domain-containing protein n=1 Tax=uncultured Roseibium sp. TaxID=1936171 RepID=UPI002616E661|nr:cupin domain-containing protein [uncultured Roseibium sp.]
MQLRADFARREVVRPEDEAWRPSPSPGVDRRMLDRIGNEVARATSIVRYAPNTRFSAHAHDGGEEFLVLEGTFADEHGAYPQGTYVRNPVGTSHSPTVGSKGCTILVKLYQFDPEDQTQTVIDTRSSDWIEGTDPGLRLLPLHKFKSERVALVHLEPNTRLDPREFRGGEEILVLEGAFRDEFGCYPEGTWIRSPHLFKHALFTETVNALLYVKTGHLPEN